MKNILKVLKDIVIMLLSYILIITIGMFAFLVFVTKHYIKNINLILGEKFTWKRLFELPKDIVDGIRKMF